MPMTAPMRPGITGNPLKERDSAVRIRPLRDKTLARIAEHKAGTTDGRGEIDRAASIIGKVRCIGRIKQAATLPIPDALQ